MTVAISDWPKAKLGDAIASGGLMEPIEVAEAGLFMLSRPRTVIMRDLSILPLSTDL